MLDNINKVNQHHASGCSPLVDLSLNILSRLQPSFSSDEATRLRLVGVHSSNAFAPVVAHHNFPILNEFPNLIILQDGAALESLRAQLSFFGHQGKLNVLPHFDVSPYSNLYPNHRMITDRIRWLVSCENSQLGDLFAATLPALLQKTLPYSVLKNQTRRLELGDSIPSRFSFELERLGYSNVPVVEDPGTFSLRGGIIDLFSAAHDRPVRLELFGDDIESLRFFDPDTQRSLGETDFFYLTPAREVFFTDENRQTVARRFKESIVERDVQQDEAQEILHAISQGRYFHGVDFMLPYFYDKLSLPLEHFSSAVNVWIFQP